MRAKPQPTDEQARDRSFVIAGHTLPAPLAVPGLHLVATPIGNLGDISLRALETLAGVSVIACEDTRITHRLTERYGIATPLTPYHEHNANTARPKLIERLKAGASIALVSDAGTPLISDPGFKLVREALASGLAVTALPGASAVLTALNLAALPTDRFFFEGFLPAKAAARRERISKLAQVDATLVLFEAGARIAASLADLAEGLGERDAALCREMTKLYEQTIRGRLAELAATAGTLETRGEFVIVIGPPAAQAAMTDAELDRALDTALSRQSVKDAVAEVAAIAGRNRREVYARALALTRGNSMQDGTDDGA